MRLPPYDKFPIISDDKVSLRQIRDLDVSDIVDISYYDAVQATTRAQAMAMQAKINQDYQNGSTIHWGIADKMTDRMVGTCGFYRGFDKGAGELGCILLPQYRGRAYMTSALLLAMDFGLNVIGLSRIWAVTSRHNTRALRLLEKLHFVKVAELEGDDVKYDLTHLSPRQDVLP